MKRIIALSVVIIMFFSLTACGDKNEISQTTSTKIVSQQEEITRMTEESLNLFVDGVELKVEWEENQAVKDLISLAQNGKITVKASQYGGFEQVGSLPENLTRNDKQTTAVLGDIMLYSGNQIVIFYGSNSWSYTKLGHITDVSKDELVRILDKDSVTITIEK